MGNVQTLLVIVVISLTLLLAVVGIQVIMVIMDLRRAIKRMNSILDDAILGGGLIKPNRLTGLIEMFKHKKEMHTYGETSSDNR